jgi:long-chain acyl-CoA synthetase
MSEQSETSSLSREEARACGMLVAVTAAEAPERMAIIGEQGDRTFAELNASANRVVRTLRARGLSAGDAVSLICSNRAEFAEVQQAATRGGFRLTCLNWHLQADEMAYIIDNSDSRAVIADARFAAVVAEACVTAPKAEVRLAIGGPIDGFDDYAAALAAEDGANLVDPKLGGTMLYTSGTTGRPKGVHRKRTPAVGGLGLQIAQVFRPDPERERSLCTGPLYHAAPLAFSLAVPINAGIGIVLMDGWSEEATLRLIEEHNISNVHMVSTMFQRLLALPEETRNKYDLSSLSFVLHGAAPTPVHVKRAIIDWFGPVVYEYYAATEGGGCFIDSEHWLQKPGSVGQPSPGQVVHILDDDGAEQPRGETGTIYFKAPDVGRFEYFKDEEKTNSAYRGDFFTLGDQGYMDEDDYLFLTGRTSELIISGGVNIYPAEVDAVLVMHDAVADVATVGVPNEEWGEEVKSVVQLAAGHESTEALADELVQFARSHLAHFKCPRSVDFDEALPRHDTGKIYRRLVRDRYWADRTVKI